MSPGYRCSMGSKDEGIDAGSVSLGVVYNCNESIYHVSPGEVL